MTNLAGKWRKISSGQCDQKYPLEIEFFEGRRYLAKKGPEQGFIWWDAGTYEAVGGQQVKISAANDAQILYKSSISEDVLTFTDEEGCEFQYQRMK